MTPETARLLQHWRSHQFQGIRPFFCQIEAVETAIWLAEVAPKLGARVAKFLGSHQRTPTRAPNPELMRVALKLATGAGKTTVMAMLIAWQTVNAARHPNSKTLLTRLSRRRARHHDPGPAARAATQRSRKLLPPVAKSSRPTCSAKSIKAKIVITNYHAFKLRERWRSQRDPRARSRAGGAKSYKRWRPKGRCSSASCPS